ncbi:unnamed protein product [Brassica rapa subsp. narinosa]
MKSHCCFSGTAHGVCDCLPHGEGSFHLGLLRDLKRFPYN